MSLRRDRRTRCIRRSLCLLPCWLAFSTFTPALAAEDEDPRHAHDHVHDEHGDTETIVVTASPLEHDRDELSVPVDRIDRDELLDHLGSTLGETLRRTPGLSSTGFAAGASRPVVRGQDAFRTELLEDGLRTQDVSRESPDHAVPVNPLAAKRVEIVRGPATLRYGGGASAGVVNVITDRVPDRLPAERLSGELFGGIGLLAGERDLAARLDGSRDELAWHADGLLRRQDKYSIPNDDDPHTQTGSQVEAWMGSVGAAWIGERGRLGASYTRAENVYGIPEEGEPVEIDMHTDRFRFEGDLYDPLDGIRALRVRGVYSDYEHEEVSAGETKQTYRNEEFEGRLELIHESLAGFDGAVGLQGRHRDFRGEGEAAEFLSPAETRTVALYVFEERSVGEAITAELGLRVEHTSVEGTDRAGIRRDFDFTPVSGALGFVIEPLGGLQLGLNGSISQRAPSQVELLARGPHEATETFELGNTDLREETSYTGQLRVEATHARGRFEAAGFVTQYDDFIFAALSGAQVNDDGDPPGPGDDPLDLLRYANRDALFWGGEISGELDLVELDCGVIGLDAQFDFVRARFDSAANGGQRDLPRIVPIRWGGGLNFRGESLEARIGFIRNEAQERTGDFESATASFTYLDASLVHRFEPREGFSLALTIDGRNLADVRARNHIAFNKEEVLLPGRSIRFGLRARF